MGNFSFISIRLRDESKPSGADTTLTQPSDGDAPKLQTLKPAHGSEPARSTSNEARPQRAQAPNPQRAQTPNPNHPPAPRPLGPSPASRARSSRNPTLRDARQKVLVVDDDTLVLRSLSRALRSYSIDVVPADSASHALAVFAAQPSTYAAVLTDFQMPGKTGLALAEEIRALDPQIPIYIMSGYGACIDLDRAREIGVREILEKPLRIDEIAERFRAPEHAREV